MELVSVIMPTYNAETTVVEALESVKNQTYPRIELIIGDDCSIDNTVEIVENWLVENKDAFYDVKFIKNKKNLGVAGNLRNCINASNGEYSQGCAGDDRLVPEAIEEKYKVVREKKLPCVLNKVHCFGDNWVKVQLMQQYMEECYALLKKDRETQLRYNLRRNYLHASMINFFNVSFLKKMKYADLSYNNLEDWPFGIKLIKEGVPLVLIDKELQHYRITAGSLSGAMRNETFKRSCAKVAMQISIPTMIQHGWYKDAKEMFYEYFGGVL